MQNNNTHFLPNLLPISIPTEDAAIIPNNKDAVNNPYLLIKKVYNISR